MLGYSAIPWLASLCVCMAVVDKWSGQQQSVEISKQKTSHQVWMHLQSLGRPRVECGEVRSVQFGAVWDTFWAQARAEIPQAPRAQLKIGRTHRYDMQNAEYWTFTEIYTFNVECMIESWRVRWYIKHAHQVRDEVSRSPSVTRIPHAWVHRLQQLEPAASAQIFKSCDWCAAKKVAVFGLNSERLVGNFDQLCQLISSICMMFHLMFLYFGTYFLRFWIWQDVTGRQSCTERFGSSCATLNCEFKGDDTVDPGATRKYQTRNVKTCGSTNQNRNVDLGKFEFAWEAEARVAGWWATLQLWPPRGQPRARRTWHETKRTGQNRLPSSGCKKNYKN